MYDGLNSLVAWDGGLTLLAPFVAIALALLTRKVIPSLAAAAVVGALVAQRLDVIAAAQTLAVIVRDAVWDTDHLLISVFSLLVAGMVGVMGRAGGTRALIGRVEGLASGPRGAMTASWLAGAVVFFDDYANCLVVGSAMGPLYDRHKVSRAKLAYIVDATAAPVASLALISTWVGFEVGLIGDTMADPAINPFGIFLAALPYRFYCILTLVFVGAIALSGRDFGPMYEAEQRARKAVDDEEARQAPPATRASLAAVPIAVLVLLTFGLMLRSGWVALGDAAGEARLFEILGEADAYTSMFLGSLVSFLLACAMALATRTLDLEGVRRGAWGGMHAVVQALAVLYLAWTLGAVIELTGAGPYIAGALEGRFKPWLFPAMTFGLASATSFATGSSFFTMGALIPLVIPIALQVDGGVGPIFLASCAAVLDGAVLGDHASPISDTTILSSIGANVDVVEHVRTQLPYVIAVGAVAVLCGAIPAGLGWSPLLLIPVGAAACIAVVMLLGKRVEA